MVDMNTGFDMNTNSSWLVVLAMILYISAYSPFIYNIFSRKNVNQKFKKEYYYILIGAFSCILLHSYITGNYLIMLYASIKIIIAIALIVGKILYP